MDTDEHKRPARRTDWIRVHLWFIVWAEQVAREGHLLFSDLNGLGARRDRAGATR